MKDEISEEDKKYEEEQIQIHSGYWRGVSGKVMLKNHRDECECGSCLDNGHPNKCCCKKCSWIKCTPCNWKDECIFSKEVGDFTSASPTSKEGMELSLTSIPSEQKVNQKH